MESTEIKGIAFVSIYTDDFEKSYKFYSEVLGLKKQFDMGDQACFFEVPENTGLYLQGGNKTVEFDDQMMRAAFVFSVESASAMWEKLKAEGLKLIQDEPMDMGAGDFFFQFYDPTGNILEILGGK
ncbi:MAG: VOC family protein [Calditrichaeota bacterium]|nr:VOC family protein [Calditrichota bacterium]